MEFEITTPAYTGQQRMQYELPPQGTTLAGYVVRRLQKTALLTDLERNRQPNSALALIQFGIYAAASATSWGPALYQPDFGSPGARVTENDPDTGTPVSAHFVTDKPYYTFTFTVQLPDGGQVQGSEQITGTTVTLRGLGMPAPSRFDYRSPSGDYEASAVGTMYSELGLGFFRATQIRGFGELQLSDSAGNSGKLILKRTALMSIDIKASTGQTMHTTYQLK